MKIDKSLVGKKFKNLKDLCSFFGFEYSEGGMERQKLIKDISKCFTLSKEGNALIIEEVKENELVRLDARKLAKGQQKYVEHISIQLLNYLAQSKRTGKPVGVFLTASKLAEITGMVNSKYSIVKYSFNEFMDENPDLTNFDRQEFYFRTAQK